jgi:arsenate reductase
VQLTSGNAADRGAIRQLLLEAGLPEADLTDELCGAFLVGRRGDDVIAAGAVERCGRYGLLRSIVVVPSLRSRGLGAELVRTLEAKARNEGLESLYLLTTDQQDFFSQLGFRKVSRTEAPDAVRATAQFKTLCPASSTLMIKVLNKPLNILFLCSHNSARSILAEGILNGLGKGRFRAFSAGSHPAPGPNPLALETLQRQQLPTEELRSKAWDEFAEEGAPVMDFVITVCDRAAGEVCPVWPGQPVTAHWGVEDPAQFQGSEEDKRHRFALVAGILKRRIELFVSLPLATLSRLALEKRVRDIGRA